MRSTLLDTTDFDLEANVTMLVLGLSWLCIIISASNRSIISMIGSAFRGLRFEGWTAEDGDFFLVGNLEIIDIITGFGSKKLLEERLKLDVSLELKKKITFI